jgi:transposase
MRVLCANARDRSCHTAAVSSTPLSNLDTLDREALMKIVLEQQNQMLEQQQEASQKIEHLKLVVEKYKRMLFGTKSEKIKGELEQLEFQLEELEVDQAAKEAALPPAAQTTAKSRRRRPRKPLPEDLPREVITYPPSTTCCPDCGGALRQFGEDVSEQLERIPASYKVIQHVRPKFACGACEQVVQAPAPTRPIDQGLPGPGLLAHVLVSKFADHLPLYRQSEIYSREGIELSRSTLAGWVGAATELLSPLVEQIRRYVMAGSKIHADDTPVAVLAPGQGKTKTARLWTYVRDDRPAGCQTAAAVWFAYSQDRKGEHPRQHLREFRGALQADAYAGFHHLYGEGVICEVACWAHARRKFHEIHQAHASPTTSEALMRIGALYGIEEEIRGKPVELRSAIRQARARPLLDSLRHWMEKALGSLSKKSETATAIRYSLSHWRALTRYVEDGLLEIDNSAAERSLRAVVLGRKNYLFMGSDSGGQRAAALYSLIGSAKLNGLDPALYLRTLLEKLPDHPINQIQQLLPWNFNSSLQNDPSQAA